MNKHTNHQTRDEIHVRPEEANQIHLGFSTLVYMGAAIYLGLNYKDDGLGGPNILFFGWLIFKSFSNIRIFFRNKPQVK